MKQILKQREILLFGTVVFLIFGVPDFTAGDYYEDLSRELKTFNELYKELVVNYVDHVNPDALLEAGINGMLETLDPYTVYLEDEEQHGIRTLTQGKYGGVGIRLGVRKDTLTVIAPIEEGPADREGVLPGDRIIQIDTVGTAEMRLSKAASLMRGEAGTQVTLTILRPGVDKRIPFVLTREDIVVHDLAFAELVTDGIAYLKLTSFSRNSAEELRKAVERLGPDSIQAIILDLRDNPGGLLTAALDVVELFVSPGKEVLTTRGRMEETNRTFTTETDPVVPEDLPMAVLVNEGSASASEIVSGVLQDLDRAAILGTDTFGKGLVQSVIPLNQHASLKVTTAKYYIPSGRLIQKEDYFDKEVVTVRSERDSVYYTNNHRKVYGGGGITPDIIVRRDSIPKVIREIWAENHFFHYAVSYHNQHPGEVWPFSITERQLDEFISYLDTKGFEFITKSSKLFRDFKATLDSSVISEAQVDKAIGTLESYLSARESWQDNRRIRRWLRWELEQEFAEVYGGEDAHIRTAIRHDETYQTALGLLQNQTRYRRQLGYAKIEE